MDVHIAAGLLCQNGRFLLGKRSAHRLAFPGVWDLPGGHVEACETAEQALVRELREELGVTATSWQELDTLREPAANGEPDTLNLHIFAVSNWEGEPSNILPEEHDEIAWFTAEEASKLTLALDAYPILFRRALASNTKS
jgi:8-oxo-dGTP diphosphatase